MHADGCLNFSLTEDLCKNSFINPTEKKTKEKMKFIFRSFRPTLYDVDQRFDYEDCFFFHSYVLIFQKISKFTFSSIENHFEIVFIAVSEKFVKFFSQL